MGLAPAHHIVVEPPPFEHPPLPPGTLAGQVALVTGGGSGMGRSMGIAFGQAGADVVTLGRSIERAEEGAEAIRALGARAIGVAADVRDPEQIAAAFDQAEDAFGAVSILANNAGGNFSALAEQMSANQWRSVTRIAIDGTFFASTEFARRRIAARGGGAIVNNSAQYIWSGFPGDAHSAAAKAAIATQTTALAAEWREHHIRVNCVAAGFFPHNRAIGAEGVDPERLGLMVPIGRPGRIREFGWMAAFLCSPYAAGITGETLVIDGGDRLRRILMNPVFVPPRERDVAWGVAP